MLCKRNDEEGAATEGADQLRNARSVHARSLETSSRQRYMGLVCAGCGRPFVVPWKNRGGDGNDRLNASVLFKKMLEASGFAFVQQGFQKTARVRAFQVKLLMRGTSTSLS